LGEKAKRQEGMTRVVVCDTGPLIHLSEAGALHLLSLAGDILIPPLVADEYEANAHGWKPPQWVKIVALEKNSSQQADEWVHSGQIDAGEAQAISLTRQINAGWLLTDDARARQFAESLGIEAHGSIGVLLWCMSNGHISDSSQ
jgi:predicted nucleic acid-binding protein